ncbi:MAG: HAD-IIB family hydrolase [Paraglaciecola sp.]|uniref:HAD-IIB family hydrolase n=1 Tax=Paraglaciecola sp. TaxID=1920173 RepID=UPI0032632302
MNNSILVFSDLDGTLLDHHTYSFSAAVPTLSKLAEHDIPVIPTTSKTYAELKQIRNDLGLDTPFIVENGAAIFIPIGFFTEQPKDTVEKNGFWIKEFSKPVSYWRALLGQLKTDFEGKFNHFANMSTSEIVDATGLSDAQAEQAGAREYGEPILWLSDQDTKIQFLKALESLGAKPLQGGRFLHLSGQCDKGKALLWLKELFEITHSDNTYTSIALGDGQNDVAMLNAADIAVRILSPVNEPPTLSKENDVHTTKRFGPEGWADSLNQIIFNC